nr:O-antigen ligase family protein [Lachnospiraceae bacterium]
RGIEDVYRHEFLSTIGQKTWFSSYLMIAIPMSLHLFATVKNKTIGALAGISLFIEVTAAFLSYSDSALLGVAVMLVVMGFMYAGDKEGFERYLEMIFIVSLSFFAVILSGPYLYVFDAPVDEAVIMKIVNRPIPFMITSFLCSGISLMLSLYLRKKRTGFEKQKGLIRTVLILLAVAGTLTVIFVLSGKDVTLFAKGTSSFTSDSWGNNRGFIWRIAIETFSQGSIKDKLFGVGPDLFYNASDRFFHDEIYHVWGVSKLSNAHNEFLNMLVTEGILGLVAYAGLFLSSMMTGIRCLKKDTSLIILVAAVLAYMVHNFFCYQQCISTPLVFIVLGMIVKKDN